MFQKAEDKNIKITDVNNFVNADKERKNKKAWQSSLADHLPEHKLPDFEIVYQFVKEFIVKILDA